uniref:Sulfurtransferase n=1 Tax=Macrostomum lignano TaxID=282301 RepID=A0A1I8H258_9PLAT
MPLITKFEYLMPAATRPQWKPHSPRRQEFPVPDISALPSTLANAYIGNDSHVIVYDNCMFAPRVWWMFRMFGHEAVSVLDGGLAAWVAEGRRVTSGPLKTVYQSVEFQASEDKKSALYRSFEEFCKALQSASVQVADARSPARFRGEEPEPRAGLPAGHPLGAANLFFRSLYDSESGRMLTEDQLRKKFLASGLDPSRPLVTTCGSGITACHVALAAHVLGNSDAAVYDGSWEEFATRGPSDLKAESGPTLVGDEWSDPVLMQFLEAKKEKKDGNNFYQWTTLMCPRQVLDRLHLLGYRVSAMTGVGQTCIWTLHTENDGQALKSIIESRVASSST